MKEIFVRLGALMQLTDDQYEAAQRGMLDSKTLIDKVKQGDFILEGDSYAVADNFEVNNFDLPTIEHLLIGKTPDPHEVADVQARLDCEIAEWLEKTEIGNCAEWMERNYFLYDLAVEFTSDPEWNNPEKELNLCIREFCNHKKKQLLQSKAKFKVGDWAYYFTSGNLEQVYIADICWDSCGKEYRYGIGFGGAKYVDHDDIWEGELHKTPQDALEYLKERVEKGGIIQYYK